MAEFRAKCTVGGYTGDWHETEQRAVADAVSHMQSSEHPTVIQKKLESGEIQNLT